MPDLVISVAILVSLLCFSLAGLISCFFLNEASRNLLLSFIRGNDKIRISF
ncbi:MAG: hypothetical protein ABIH71_01435 [Candidatus Omnitrophota bacterium]